MTTSALQPQARPLLLSLATSAVVMQLCNQYLNPPPLHRTHPTPPHPTQSAHPQADES